MRRRPERPTNLTPHDYTQMTCLVQVSPISPWVGPLPPVQKKCPEFWPPQLRFRAHFPPEKSAKVCETFISPAQSTVEIFMVGPPPESPPRRARVGQPVPPLCKTNAHLIPWATRVFVRYRFYTEHGFTTLFGLLLRSIRCAIQNHDTQRENAGLFCSSVRDQHLC